MKEIINHIHNLENSLLRSDARASCAELDTLLCDDFIEFASSGSVYTKDDILARLPEEAFLVNYILQDFKAEVLSNNIVMTHFKTTHTKNSVMVTALRTSLWRRENNSWRIFFHQGTKIL
ncbi:MAG: DUF4440 domain-containing protein [Candidatus Pacebacteria bacterium]|nr:DUF4440 domain-containing protein [Candidatus Paceibacterota bacterium]MCD8507833.1 DUF4440 domain-containing protein [Candidatus Paceibacterota bacterium]MCD8563567.1 DUF4440 domain-containing protein [Candidatus Paceibacterota bacterium]